MKSEMMAFCEKHGITIECTYGANKRPASSSDMHGWRVTLKHGRKRFTCDFFQGSAHTKEPTAADVLSCLCSDAQAGAQSFEDFCSEFGDSTDSRKAHETWKACASTARRLPRFLGDLYEAACSSEH
jgi:hypothetical protein